MSFSKQSVLYLFTIATAAFGQTAHNRYALILEDPPVSERFATRAATESSAGKSYRQQIEAKQQLLRA